MNIRATLLGLALGGTALGVAACNNGSTAVGPTPGPTCGPAGIQTQLLFPNPAGTPAPNTIPQIVIAVSSPLPNNEFNLYLTYNGGSAYTGNYLGQITAGQLPAGSATPSFANPIYEAVNLISNLNGASTYSVAINDTFSNCTPQNIPNATFHTQ